MINRNNMWYKNSKNNQNIDAPEIHSGCMIALYLPISAAQHVSKRISKLKNPEKESDLHLTLVYLGKHEDHTDAFRDKVISMLRKFTKEQTPIMGNIGGIGCFATKQKDGSLPFYASYNSPQLASFREELCDELRKIGYDANDSMHGFTPHITLSYIKNMKEISNFKPIDVECNFYEIVLAWGEEHHKFVFDLSKETKAYNVWNNYRFAGNRLDFLASQGVNPEVAAWVDGQEAQLANMYTSELRKNPLMTIFDLQNLPVNLKEPEFNEMENHIYNILAPRCNTIQFPLWVRIQMKKMRLANIPYPSLQEITHVRDWAQYLQNTSARDATGQSTFQLPAYTWDQAAEATEHWTKAMSNEGTGLYYNPVKEQNIVYAFGGEYQGWTIQKVVTENDLKVEGKKQHHCVGGYCHDVTAGKSNIYSLRDPFNEPKVTLELNGTNQYIRQIQGPSNSEPDDEYKALIKEWFTNTMPDVKHDTHDDIEFGNWKFEDFDDALKEAFEGDEYGIKISLANVNFVSILEAIIKQYSNSWNNRKSWYRSEMKYFMPTFAKYTIKADIEKLTNLKAENKKIHLDKWYRDSQCNQVLHFCDQTMDDQASMMEPNFTLDEWNAPDEPEPEDYENGKDDPIYISDYYQYEKEYEEWREKAEEEQWEAYYDDAKQYLPYGLCVDLAKELQEEKEESQELKQLISEVVTSEKVTTSE